MKLPVYRPAKKGEVAKFEAQLSTILDHARRRLSMLADPTFEVRVGRVRAHNVKVHTRQGYERIYLAKKPKTTGPRASTPAGVVLAKLKARRVTSP